MANRDGKLVARVRKDKGIACANCGSTDNIEWHHVVPIHEGGNDIITNLVPLCHVCHMKAHGHTPKAKSFDVGRPRHRKPPHCDKILMDYFECRIGKQEAMSRLGRTDFRITTWWVYKEFVKKQGIKAHRNNIDLHTADMSNGTHIGWIEWEDGTRKDFYFQGEKKPPNCDQILNDFLDCKIGTIEAKRRLGKASSFKISEYKPFQELLKKRNVAGYRNNVDRHKTISKGGTQVGWIQYENGMKTLIYKREGE